MKKTIITVVEKTPQGNYCKGMYLPGREQN